MRAIVHADYWPFVVLLLSVAMVVILITRWRFHPFVTLMLSAIFVGLISPAIPTVPGQSALIAAVELPMTEFGVMAGKIAWVIALAAVIGTAMMESGAAEVIVNWLLKTLGEKQTATALVISGFLLSIPVFFDTVFFLLIPIGITLARKTGKDFVLYVVAIGGGGVISHSIVPPTPGPLIMAETLHIDLGLTILAGLVTGLIPAGVVLVMAKRLNKKYAIPVRVNRTSETAVAAATFPDPFGASRHHSHYHDQPYVYCRCLYRYATGLDSISGKQKYRHERGCLFSIISVGEYKKA